MATRNIEALTSELKIGNGSNYTAVQTDGTIRQEGDASAWRDLVGDLFGKRLNSTTGKVDYDWDENAIKFQSGGSISTKADRVGANLQYDHYCKMGSISIYPHIHWFQPDSQAYEFTLQYRIQFNGSAQTTSWTTITYTVGSNEVYTYPGSGTFNQISKLGTITATMDISDTIQIQIARTDSLVGDVLVYFMDMHVEIDSFGSKTEWSKD